MNTVEYLIKKLKGLGVTDFFGLPGDYNLNIVSAIEDDSDVNWVGCTNELNAGYAADGYARQKGYGALVTTYGVGELSALNAVAGSYAENIPVVHIVGTPSAEDFNCGKILHHSFSGASLETFMENQKNVTAAFTFLKKDGAKLEIDRVLKVLTKEKTPVYIAIPADVALTEVSDRETDYEWISDSNNLENVIRLIAEKINYSNKPLILADTLIKRFNAKEEFTAFAKESGIPVTNFLMGAGIYNSDNYAGTLLTKHENPEADKLIRETDCLISVGVINGDLNSYFTNLPYKINSHIAIYGTHTYIEGHLYENVKMSDVLKGITQAVKRKNLELNLCERAYSKPEASRENLKTDYIYPRLREFIKEGDIIIAECGTISHGIFKMNFPDNIEIHSQLIWCSTGWATAAALGVCAAKPDTRVIVITGEGAHQISAMEIGNMCRFGMKPVFIIINNNGYETERIISGKPDAKFNDVMQIDYPKFVRSFKGDIWSTQVKTDDDFDKALRVTQIMDKLCYIETLVKKDDYANVLQNLKPINQPSKRERTEKSITNTRSEIRYETNVHSSIKDYDE